MRKPRSFPVIRIRHFRCSQPWRQNRCVRSLGVGTLLKTVPWASALLISFRSGARPEIAFLKSWQTRMVVCGTQLQRLSTSHQSLSQVPWGQPSPSLCWNFRLLFGFLLGYPETLCRPGCSRTHREPPASAFSVMGLKVSTTTAWLLPSFLAVTSQALSHSMSHPMKMRPLE